MDSIFDEWNGSASQQGAQPVLGGSNDLGISGLNRMDSPSITLSQVRERGWVYAADFVRQFAGRRERDVFDSEDCDSGDPQDGEGKDVGSVHNPRGRGRKRDW